MYTCVYIGEQNDFDIVVEDIEIDLYSIFLVLQLLHSGINYLILACLLQALDYSVLAGKGGILDPYNKPKRIL